MRPLRASQARKCEPWPLPDWHCQRIRWQSVVSAFRNCSFDVTIVTARSAHAPAGGADLRHFAHRHSDGLQSSHGDAKGPRLAPTLVLVRLVKLRFIAN